MTIEAAIGVMQFTNHETPRIARGHQKLGIVKEGFFPSLQSEHGLADTLIQTSGLQNCETINFYCFKPPSL